MSDAQDADRHQKVFDIFCGARTLAGEARRAFLDESCGDDDALRESVESLLASADEGDEFLEASPVVQGLDALVDSAMSDELSGAPSDEPLPETIGGHRIVGLLGRGGMGVVYEAEQANPKRRVALKTLSSSLGSEDLRARFLRETQLLAELQHPGIARVLEAGIDTEIGLAGGQPFFVMELVQGLPITESAKERRLDDRAVLELVAATCDAVAHAHHEGVIHRDLKPGNILVTKDGQPKILDFGIARRLGEEGSATFSTSTGLLLGTLPYMSPELVSGRPDEVGEQSDVYALGVILFELLTGRLPHDFENRPFGESLDILRDSKAPLLRTEDGRYRGDLETIVAKALEKDRSDRYASVAALAADIRRYLNHEPIQARRPGLAYRAVKFVRRHPALTVLAALLVVACIAGTTVSLILARDARTNEKEARRASMRASLGAAESALMERSGTRVRKFLNAVPPSLRGWEWNHLHARSDHSIASRSFEEPWGNAPFLDWTGTGPIIAVAQSERRGALTSLVGWHPATDMVEELGRLNVEGRHWATDAAVPLALGHIGSQGAGIQIAEARDTSAPIRTVVRCPSPSQRKWCSDRSWRAAKERPITLAGGRRIRMTARSIRAVDSESGEMLWAATDHANMMSGAVASHDGSWVMSTSWDGTLKSWDTETGALLVERSDHRGRVVELDRSPDLPLVATGGIDGTIRIYSEDLSNEVAVLLGSTASVRDLVFGSDGRLASNDSQGRAFLWDHRSSDDCWVSEPLPGFGLNVRLSPDGQLLATKGWSRALSLWDRHTGDLVARIESDDWSRQAALAFGPQSRRIAVPHTKGGVEIIDLWSGKATHLVFDGGGAVVRWSDQDRLMVVSKGHVRVFDAVTGTLIDHEEIPSGHAACSPDGGRLAIATTTDLIVQDWQTSTVVHQNRHGIGRVEGLHYSPDGRWLVCVGQHHSVQIWDAATGELARELRVTDGSQFSAGFSPDMSRLFVGGRGGLLRVWSVPEFEELVALRGHEDYIHDLCVSQDGSEVFTVSGDRTLRTWSTHPSRRRAQSQREREEFLADADRLLGERLARGMPSSDLVGSVMEDRALEPALRRLAAQRAMARILSEAEGLGVRKPPGDASDK